MILILIMDVLMVFIFSGIVCQYLMPISNDFFLKIKKLK